MILFNIFIFYDSYAAIVSWMTANIRELVIIVTFLSYLHFILRIKFDYKHMDRVFYG